MGRWCRRAAGLVAMEAQAASAAAEPADRCSAIGVLVVIGEPEAVGRRTDELLQRRSTANSFRVR